MCDYTRPGVKDWWNNPKPGQLEAAEKLLDKLEEEGLEEVETHTHRNIRS